MKFSSRRFLLLVVVLVATLAAAEAGHRLRSRSRKDGSNNSPGHHRSKRTLGNIINWKLNLLQQIFGGITGLFGGGKKRPRPGYGAPGRRPNRPNRPRPGGPRPGYGPPKGRPQRPQRPSYGGGGRPQSNGGGSFGPSNAIYMLPAPNLATAAPQNFGGAGRPQAPQVAQDSYGAPAADPIVQDGYGAPAAPPISAAAPIAQDSYGAPAAAPISSNPVDSYGAPQGSVIAAAAPASAPVEAVPYNPQWTPINAPGGLGRAPARRPITTSTAEQYGAPPPRPITDIDLPEQPNVIVADPDTKSQVDVYGSPLAPVGTSAPVPAGVLVSADAPTSFDAAPFFIPSDDYDDYDPSDIPPDQAAPVDELDTYGAPPAPAVVEATEAPAGDYDDYDPSDIPPDQAKKVDVDTEAPAVAPDYEPTEAAVDGSGVEVEAVEPLDEVVDLRSGKKLDVAEVEDVSNAIDDVAEVSPATEVPILFTTATADEVEETKLPKFVSIDEFIKLQQNRGGEEEISSVTDIAITPTLAPLIVDITGKTGPDEDITEIVEVLERDRAERLLPLPEDIRLDDPLNIIPDDYYSYEEDEDVSIVEDKEEVRKPVFADLRSEVQFTTGSAADPVPTTYSPPIDREALNLGTTVAENLLLPEHDYTVEEEEEDLKEVEEELNEIDDDYYSDDEEDRGGDDREDEFDVVLNNVNFPIIIEETNTERVNDPVILLVGTPEEKEADGAVTTTRRRQQQQTTQSSVILDDTSFTFTPLETTRAEVTTELPLFDTQPPAKAQAKRRAKNRSSLADRYNNWFGKPNDWSHRIQRLQGARIRFKNGNEFGRAARRSPSGGN